ncbi:MAG: 4Fe-4S binding protein [Candidatus Dadabacteria bacterium]|nr:MAG: 4Fe-4S binding protein [Candidatus Dadabacteria bacterium]
MTLGALFGLSLLYKNFWCRYLCPYGGFLGLLSTASPVKIRRNAGACINCGLCAKNCPSLLPVDTKTVVRSPECTGCLTCVSHCPAMGALDAAISGGRAVRPEIYAAAVAVVFFGIVLIARITGKWHSSLPAEELLQLMPFLDRLSHP